MKKVALYSRVSTDKQENGLQAQTRSLLEYCKTRSITEYEVFEDFNVSGSKASRPQLDRMMKEVREGKIDTVVVYSFSRFARSTRFLLESLEEFSLLKVNFVSISESVDLGSALGRAMFTIISAIATLERELISERVRNGMVNAKAKGKRIGRPQSIPDGLVITLLGEGYKYREISKMLNISQGSIADVLKRQTRKQKSSTIDAPDSEHE
jgi:DNA invertase Pin-like site-specific DNA recombinase